MSRAALGVVDTNVIVLIGQLRPEDLPVEPVITAVTLAELSAGPLATHDPAERAARQRRLQEVEASFDPLPFDAAAARTFGLVAAEVHAAGRRIRPRAFDALIAATAIANDLPLYTCNPKDFTGISGLELVAVRQPSG